MKQKYDHVIAIDPDVSESGVAYLRPDNRILEVTNLSFPQLLDNDNAKVNKVTHWRRIELN
jgi:hypothetical protein